MKIALIIHKLNVRGGVQRHVLSVACELQKRGHGVKIYTFAYSPDCFPALANGLEVVSLKNYAPLRNLVDVFKENRASRDLAFLIDKDTEILNPHDQVCYKVAYYFKKRVKNAPSIWTMHDMPSKRWFFWREKQFRPELAPSFLRRLGYLLWDLYDLKFIKVQNKVLVLGGRDQNWVKEYFGKEAEIIRNGVDSEKFAYIKRNPPAGKKVKLLMNGIFFSHRRFEDGIYALKSLRDQNHNATLEIIGDPGADKEYYAKIGNLVSALGLGGAVKFSGRVTEKALLKSYAASDIFIFPNHLQSWGLAVFEAMATGLPVIVSRSAGASEVLTHNETALLVEPKSPEEIARAVETLISDKNLYTKLSRDGRQFVEENISWGRLAGDMIKIFNEAV